MRIGQRQLQLLMMTALPFSLLLTTDKVSSSLVRIGLFREDGPGGACCITPAGLRALAAEMEAGRVLPAIEAAKRDAERRAAKRRAAK